MSSHSGGVRTADDWIERVRQASDIVEIVGETVALRRAGRSWTGLCPFHGEKTPSFTVSTDRQLYHCFSCKAGGDVFRFVQEREKIGFLEAAEWLSRRAAIPVPERRGDRGGLRATLAEALELAAASYEHWLRDPVTGARVRGYLATRGLSEATIHEFRLGLALEGWSHLAERLRGRVSEETLVQAGLSVARDGGRGIYDRFRNRLMIPLIAPGGAVVGFGARALGDESPKYLNSPETAVYRKSAFLFGLDVARRHVDAAGELVVVEGYFDVIALHQAGIRHVVATSGTALTGEHARTFARLAPRVILTFDGDAAGRDATMRSVGSLLAAGLDVRVVDLPMGEDPDTVVRREGVAGWETRRAAAADAVEFVHRHVLASAMRSGASGAEGLERAVAAILQLALGIEDPVRARLFLGRSAEVLGVAEAVLVRGAALRRRGGNSAPPVRAAVRAQQHGEERIERQLLRSLIESPGSVGAVQARIGPEDFREPACRALAEWMWSGHAGLPEEEPLASLARELVVAGAGSLDWAAEAQGATRRIEERRWKEQLKEHRHRLGQAKDNAEAARLMQEIDELARHLRERSA